MLEVCISDAQPVVLAERYQPLAIVTEVCRGCMHSHHSLQPHSITAQLGIEVSDEYLQIIIQDVVENILKLIIEFILGGIFGTVHRRIHLHNGRLGMARSETGCDDLVVNRLPTDEGFRGFFAQYKTDIPFVSIFMARVQDRLTIADDSAAFCPPDFADPEDIDPIVVEFFYELRQLSALI